MPPKPFALHRYPLAHTTSLEEARGIFSRQCSPVEVEQTDRKTRFEWQANLLTVGPVEIYAHRFRGAHSSKTEPVGDIFSVAIPLSSGGHVVDTGRPVALVANRTAWIVSPGSSVRMQVGGDYQALQVTVARAEMERAFVALAGAGSPALRFEPEMILATTAGSAFRRLLRFVVDEAEHEQSSLTSPLVAARFADALVFGLLLGQPHRHSGRLRNPLGSNEPRHVRVAAEYIVAHADRALRMADLAALTGVSVRSLQLGFQKQRGCSPMAFLKERRLVLARTKLLDAAPGVTVAAVAYECGFEHLGRFSVLYRARFGETPSQTRRKVRC